MLGSISSPFVGLRGVRARPAADQAGGRRALAPVAGELRTFVTLSPVPGFGPWLRGRLAAADVPSPAANGVALDVAMGELRTAMAAAAVDDDALWSAPPPAAATDALLRLCALYLCTVKRGGGGGGGGHGLPTRSPPSTCATARRCSRAAGGEPVGARAARAPG